MPRITGSVITVPRASGNVFYLKARDRTGRQIKRKLGPVHTGRGSAPAGVYTRKQADDALREWLTDLGREPDRQASTVTLREAVESWLRYVEHEKARAPSTVSDYRNAANRYLVLEMGAETPVASITTDTVSDLKTVLLGKVSRRTAQKALVLLHGVLAHARRRRWIDANPAADVDAIGLDRTTEFAVLSPAEVEHVARHAKSRQAGALILVAAFTGLRLGELRGLRWRDVDFESALVHVRRSYWRGQEGTPKSGKARSVPLIDQAAAELDALSRRGHHVGPDDHVFCAPRGGRLKEEAVRRALYDAMKAAGVDRDRGTGQLFRFHDLRHTFGTLAVRAFPLSDVKAYMGHAHIETTMVYVHHVPQHDAARRLGAVVAAGRVPDGYPNVQDGSGEPADLAVSQAA